MSLHISVDRILKIAGGILVIGGFAILLLIYSPLLKQEINYQIRDQKVNKEIVPIDQDFGLIISKIGINVKVFANVDSQNPKEYLPILVKGVAQAKGSALPGQEGIILIFAHSSDTPLNAIRYNAVFYLLNKMENNDEIIIFFQNKKYLYKISGKKILAPAEMENYLKTLKGKNLILQTCYPPGTTLKRLLIIAEGID